MSRASFPPLTGAYLEQLCERATRFTAPRWQRPELVQALAQEALPSPRVAELAQEGCVAIVTGQQPAVGGGPLYTLLKIAHAMALAEALRARGRPCVAVFWCASEDHDLGEAGHADLITRQGTVARFTTELGPGSASLRFRHPLQWHDALLQHLRTHLGDGLGRPFLDAYTPLALEGMGAWLNRLLRGAFGDTLVCVEAHRLRGLWRDGARQALTQWPAGELERVRQEILADGGADAFGALPEAPFFADAPSARTRLERTAALQLLEHDPTLLSPGAAIRPILQQLALPAVAYVGGDGELAYHAFLGPLYDALTAVPPQLVPRLHGTLVPSWLQRASSRWGVPSSQLATLSAPPALDTSADALAAMVRDLDALIARYQPAAMQRVHLRGRLHRLMRARVELARGLQQEARSQQRLPPFGQLTGYVRPRNQPQERVMSLMQALWEHGPGLCARLVAVAAENLGGGTCTLELGHPEERP